MSQITQQSGSAIARELLQRVLDWKKTYEDMRIVAQALEEQRDAIMAERNIYKAELDNLRVVNEIVVEERKALLAQKPAWTYEGYKNDLNACRAQLRQEQAKVERLQAEVLELKHLLHYAKADTAKPLNAVTKERDEAVALLRDFYTMARAEHEADLWVRVQRFFREHPPQVVVVDEKGRQR